MANIMDYLDWRGDLEFQSSPLNEIDNLIFSQIPYVELEGIVSWNEDGITIKEAAEIFFQKHDRQAILDKVSMTKMSAFVMEKMAHSERFKNARLFRYINDISLEEESQFCAVCIEYAPGHIFVAYSGTDNTIVGWKEDFNMSFLSETPGQLKAVEYLNYFKDRPEYNIEVGGHSKGGNLAVYASVYCDRDLQERINAIYSNDGPGVTSAMQELEEYRRITDRIHSIIPESSIVGMLFERTPQVKVVKSDNKGAMQHDGMSWEVLGTSFVEAQGVSSESLLLERTLKSWIQHLNSTEREIFVDTLFGILDYADITSTEELAKIKWKKFAEMVKASTNLPKESQDMIGNILKMLWREANRSVKQAREEKKIRKLW